MKTNPFRILRAFAGELTALCLAIGAHGHLQAATPDGQYLFFSRHDGQRCVVYWVKATGLDRFRNRPAP